PGPEPFLFRPLPIPEPSGKFLQMADQRALVPGLHRRHMTPPIFPAIEQISAIVQILMIQYLGYFPEAFYLPGPYLPSFLSVRFLSLHRMFPNRIGYALPCFVNRFDTCVGIKLFRHPRLKAVGQRSLPRTLRSLQNGPEQFILHLFRSLPVHPGKQNTPTAPDPRSTGMPRKK